MSLKEKDQDDIEKRHDNREKEKDEVTSLRGAEATWQSDEFTGTLF